MSHLDFSALASEVVDTFAEAANLAVHKLNASAGATSGLAGGNTFTSEEAFRRLGESARKTREGWATLRREPAISRLIVEDEMGSQRILYIARKTGTILPSGREIANYDTALGRLAELDVGDEATVQRAGNSKTYSGNPPIFSSRQKWSYATSANFCIGVMPPRPMFGRS